MSTQFKSNIKLTAVELEQHKPDLSGWQLSEDARSLARSVKLKDFNEAFGIMTRYIQLSMPC